MQPIKVVSTLFNSPKRAMGVGERCAESRWRRNPRDTPDSMDVVYEMGPPKRCNSFCAVEPWWWDETELGQKFQPSKPIDVELSGFYCSVLCGAQSGEFRGTIVCLYGLEMQDAVLGRNRWWNAVIFISVRFYNSHTNGNRQILWQLWKNLCERMSESGSEYAKICNVTLSSVKFAVAPQ